MPVRTRFAPSPTGFLHLGGARTALFSYLYARHHGGQFVLRIEDTDRERSTEASVQAILDGMSWLQLDYDEGPVFQSDRMHRYQQVLEEWLRDGFAYHCYATVEELNELREQQRAQGLKPRYDGRYRDFDGRPPDGVTPCVRFRNPQRGEVAWDDGVRGRTVWRNDELDDLILARADGTPTYNFTVVVDDADMAISDVIRGDDHIANTPRQLNLYQALGATPPRFAHVPMILGEDGSRLSKRHGAVSVMQYAEDGFLPSAMVNYLARLGWSHGDQELFSRDELIAHFDLGSVNRSPASFSRDKLLWTNEQHLHGLAADELRAAMTPLLRDVELREGEPSSAAIEAFRERASTLVDLADQMTFLYRDFESFEAAAAKKHLRPVAAEPLSAARAALADLSHWDVESIQSALQKVIAELGIGFGKLGQPLRVAVTGRGAAPSNDVVLSLLGQETALSRIDRALAYIDARAASAA